MASANFANCLKVILHHEGGYVDHSQDPGGITNLGVTKKTYEAWIGHPVSAEIMRKLTPTLVGPLYRVKYWDVLKCGQLPIGLDLCVFDFGVNAGTNRSGRYLQRLVGVSEDGLIGPATLRAIEAKRRSTGLQTLIKDFQGARETYYKKLPHYPTFGRGWIKRVQEVERGSFKHGKGRVMTLKDVEKAALERVRVWWRPVTCIGIACGVIVNAVVLPIMNSEPISLTDFAATIASCSTIFVIREWGKINGAD